MYTTLLFIHSLLRWIILILVVVAIAKSIIGLTSGKDYQKSDNGIAAAFVGSMHLQLLVGLILYFWLSPITSNAFSGYGSPMKDPVLRYWAVEHIVVMVIAVILAQVGRSISRKSEDALVKFRFQLIFFGISFLLMLTMIPWSESARLFRF